MGIFGQWGISLMYQPVVDLHRGPVLSVHGFVGDTRVYIYIIVHFEPRDHPFCSVPKQVRWPDSVSRNDVGQGTY
jgi:hypothetical protein